MLPIMQAACDSSTVSGMDDDLSDQTKPWGKFWCSACFRQMVVIAKRGEGYLAGCNTCDVCSDLISIDPNLSKTIGPQCPDRLAEHIQEWKWLMSALVMIKLEKGNVDTISIAEVRNRAASIKACQEFLGSFATALPGAPTIAPSAPSLGNAAISGVRRHGPFNASPASLLQRCASFGSSAESPPQVIRVRRATSYCRPRLRAIIRLVDSFKA